MSRRPRPEARAAALLKRLGIESPPIPVEVIVKELDAELAYAPYDGEVSGMLVRGDGEKAVIGVNSSHAPTRQRFTIAHEIGHLLLHPGSPVFIDRFVRVNWRDGKSNLDEMQANAFAAELLMPRELVLKEVAGQLDHGRELTPKQLTAQLAKSFRVSAQAMNYRLENIGILDPMDLLH